MKIEDTRITQSGVYRCCMDLVSDRETAEIGDKAVCPHCKEAFTLTETEKEPLWLPDWQIEKRD